MTGCCRDATSARPLRIASASFTIACRCFSVSCMAACTHAATSLLVPAKGMRLLTVLLPYANAAQISLALSAGNVAGYVRTARSCFCMAIGEL